MRINVTFNHLILNYPCTTLVNIGSFVSAEEGTDLALRNFLYLKSWFLLILYLFLKNWMTKRAIQQRKESGNVSHSHVSESYIHTY